MTARAIQGLIGIRLILREHFFWKLSSNSQLKAVLDDIEISNRSLQDDLKSADLVLFTTTTTAEEAIMCEVPVWQIISEKSNFSPLGNMDQVKKIYSEKQFRMALKEFIETDSLHGFSSSVIDQVERDCFFKCDGKSSDRMARQIQNLIIEHS